MSVPTLTTMRAELIATSAGFGTEVPFLQSLGSQALVPRPGDIDCAHQPDAHLRLGRIDPSLRPLRGLIGHYCLTSG